MAALTAPKVVSSKGANAVVDHPVVASDIIYKGAICMINAAGNIAPAVATAGSFLAGIAVETMDNSAGSAGDLNARVYTEGLFALTIAGAALTDVGTIVYATDDQLVTVTSATNAQIVGRIEKYVSATEVYVRLAVSPAAGLGS